MHSTIRTTSTAAVRGGMKSITLTRPVGVCHSVSSTKRVAVIAAVRGFVDRHRVVARLGERPRGQ